MTSSGAPLDTGTQLAFERTRLAAERNMMAWIRTATSLISFGFTVYKFFEFEVGKNAPAATGLVLSPRVFGMIMIGTGLVALLLSTIEHRRNLKALSTEPGPVRPSVAGVLAAMIAAMGLAAFVAALLRG